MELTLAAQTYFVKSRKPHRAVNRSQVLWLTVFGRGFDMEKNYRYCVPVTGARRSSLSA